MSAADESFSEGRLEYPQWTRPESWRGLSVPPVLLSGDHQAVARWRLREAARRTRDRRPDLIERLPLTPDERRALDQPDAADDGAKNRPGP
jgi:tRNA (guanine37-N1)-methyltransferase